MRYGPEIDSDANEMFLGILGLPGPIYIRTQFYFLDLQLATG